MPSNAPRRGAGAISAVSAAVGFVVSRARSRRPQSSSDPVSTPGDPRGGRGAAITAVLAVGVLTAVSPYALIEGWAGGVVDPVTLVLDLLPVLPFGMVAALIVDTPPMTRRGTVATTAGLVLATVLMHRFVASSTAEGAEYALVGVPFALTIATAAAWKLDVALDRRRAASLERGETPWLRRVGSAPASNRLLIGLLAATVALPLLARAAGLGDAAAIETFVVLFASIVVEALPFVLLGALVSAAIEVYVPDRAFTRAAGLPLHLQLPGAVLGGFAFPVCECGSVPVARRLILRGLHPAAGLAFMLASPILNPIVLLSTVVAYQGRGALEMTLGRAGLGLVLALIAGLAIGRRGAEGLLRPRREVAHLDVAGHAHDHRPGPGEPHARTWRRPRALVDHLAGDFFFMGKFVVAGSALAAMLQTAVPQSVFSGVLASPFVGSLVLMGVAFLLSLCSEADAFVAVSFIQFPLSAQLAFLVFGPVLDIKLALLYGATFGRRFVLRLLLVAVPVVLAGVLVFQEVVW